MSWFQRLGNVARPARLSRELDRELSFHIAERVDELVASGMSEADAVREARRRFGSTERYRERARDADVLGWLESLVADLRYAARALRASPAFALVAVLSLALGIGANTAIFSLVDAVMLRSLPVSHPEELVQVNIGDDGAEVTNPIWEAVRDRGGLFAAAAAFAPRRFDLASGGEARYALGNWVSGGYFGMLGVRPALGRLLVPDDDRRGCAATVVLSHGFWRSEMGGDPRVVGRALALDGHPFTIVGVADASFTGLEVGRAPQVYAPICAEAVVEGKGSTLDNRSVWMYNIVARLAPGVTLADARARLAAASPAIFTATLPGDWDARGQQEYLSNVLTPEAATNGLSALRVRYRQPLLVLMGVVGVVLLIACANVANLLLARATAREHEIAVRLAMGAGRGRIVRQLLTESVMLAVLGAALGVVVARWGTGALVALLSTRAQPVWLDLAVSWRVLGFTAAVATATGVAFGLVPAWRATRVQPQAAMRARGRGTASAHRAFGAGQALVVGQVALSLALVCAAGLLLGTFRKLDTLDPGFDREGLLLVSASGGRVERTPERQRAERSAIIERLAAAPGVRAVSASVITPVSGIGWNERLRVEGFTPRDERDALAYFNGVTDGYFGTLGSSIVAGRDFTRADGVGSPRVAIVNRAMARRFFGDASPIGRTIRADRPNAQPDPIEIVDVVEDASYRSLREEPPPTVFVPIDQMTDPFPWVFFELRTAGSPSAVVPVVKRELAQVAPDLALEFTTMSDQVRSSLARERLMALLSASFGALALLLAVVGLYGIMAYGVARRRGEIGVRIALGATRARVVRLVLGEAGRLVVAGLVLGTLLALAGSRLVASFLYGLAPTDPATIALSAFVLASVALAAGALPAWRAARLDPMVALREE